MNLKSAAKLRLYFQSPYKYRWLIFIITGLIYFIACLHRVSPSVIASDLTKAFDASATTLGFIAASYFYMYSMIQPPVGLLTDTIGPRKVITFLSLIAFIGSIVFAMAATPAMAVFGRALIGIGVGGIFIPTLKLFSHWYRSDEFASLTGLFLAIGFLGGLFASLPLTYMVLFMGWRVSFLALGVVSLLSAGVSWVLIRNRPEDKGWKISMVASSVSVQPDDVQPDDITTLKRLWRVIQNYKFWLISFSSFFVGGSILTFTGLWAVPFLIDVHQYSRVEAGSLLMLCLFGFSIGSGGFGFISDRFEINRKKIILISLLLGIICWGIFYFAGAEISFMVLMPIFLIIGVCGGGAIPIFFTITKELFPPWLTGTAIGLMNPAAFLATALFQPFTGYLMDQVGRGNADAYPFAAYQNVFMVFGVGYIIAFFAVCFLKLPTDKP